jgi:hypothetical protein
VSSTTVPSPRRVAAGRLNAAKRWGPPGTPRVVKIGDLSIEARQLVLALVDAARAKKAPASPKADDAA